MQLSEVRTSDLGLAQQLAHMRLHLYLTGEVHRLLVEFHEEAQGFFLELNGDEALTEVAASHAQVVAFRAWQTFIDRYSELIRRGFKQACALPFGILAEYHERLVLPIAEQILEESAAPASTNLNIYYDEAVEAALNRRYRDGLAVSERIWLMDRKSRSQMGAILLNGVQEGRTVNQVASSLQQYIAPAPGCISRVRSLLRGAANRALLRLGKSPCGSSGVSYNAVRLARNEMTVALNIANDIMLSRMPWVSGEQIHLSPEHPEADQCDAVANGGKKGGGIYPLGTISLPLHVLCMCWKDGVQMPSDKFKQRMNGFLGGGKWPAMGRYQKMIGGALAVTLTGLVITKTAGIWLGAPLSRLANQFWLDD